MAAPQGYSRWYDDAPEHPKFLAAGHKAGWLYVCGQAYCSRQATDGKIPKAVVPRLSDLPSPMKVADRLCEVGLWHDEGDYFVQHDYCEMQRTAEEREAAAAGKSQGGAHGNHLRWHVARKVVADDCEFCVAQGSDDRSDMRSQADTESVSTESESETETLSSDPDVSDDARDLTRLLAQRVQKNGFKVPDRGQRAHADWLIAADRLLRLDDVEPGEARQVAEWATADEFWQANIRSMPKFRDQYPQLRLRWLNQSKAQAPPGSAGGRKGGVTVID